MKLKTPNAIALKLGRDRRHDKGLYEVRGIWAAKALHERIRASGARLAKAASRDGKEIEQ